MTAIILHRTDPEKNMRRFYRLDVQPDLLANSALGLLAVAAILARREVAVIDLGTRRQPATNWSDRRGDDTPAVFWSPKNTLDVLYGNCRTFAVHQ